MKTALLSKIFEFKAITQAVALKKGSLIVLSIPITFSFKAGLESLINDVKMYDLALPAISIVLCVALYFLVWLADFFTGLVASRRESKGQKGWVKSNKLYNSMGKFGGLLLIDFILLLFVLFLTVVGFEKTSLWSLVFSILINVLAMTYELHSINENIERITGNTVKILSFFDRITTLIETKIIDKISSKL